MKHKQIRINNYIMTQLYRQCKGSIKSNVVLGTGMAHVWRMSRLIRILTSALKKDVEVL